MKKRRIARPLLIAGAGAIISMGSSCICGNLMASPCIDAGPSCFSECDFASANCSTDAGSTDAGKSDGGVTNDGGTDGGP